jgi:cellular nucleic acid-binding protein
MFEEDKVTKEYMAKYGIENVRGGSYTTMELSDNERELLYREIRSAKDQCLRCGHWGHFVKDCYYYEEEEEEEWGCNYCERIFSTEYGAVLHEKSCKRKIVCYRCERPGHYSTECYASTHLKGYYI